MSKQSRTGSRAAVACVCLMAVAGASAQEQRSGPPSNLHGGAYQQLIEQMWRDSPTFRDQCDRLAGEPQLRVVIRGESRPTTTGARADSAISTLKNGKVSRADVVLRSPADSIELIAHEIEHVIERMEGVRLRDQGCTGTSGRPDAYESCRAVDAGRRVAREVQESRAAPTRVARR